MLPLRLRRVGGHDGRANDVLFHPPARPPPASAPPHPQAVVFFGGDVQDYPEVMQAHRDNRHYVKWNLESTARMLAHDFPTQFILVVKPASDSDPLWWRDKLALDECSLTLVGFSKGCVVLNQLIYEFHYTKTLTPGDAHMMSTHKTSYANFGARWRCVYCRNMFLYHQVHRYLHSQSDAPHSLHMHFDVLANFKRVQDSTPHSMPDSSDEEP
ncbi:jg18963 [Pararge aegeria aegeria]|uniref:Jg18963 protein n=1 Tax=Pararge aegeria aegeria TaxID=348720 RepID=A0A8S4SPS6_9NEOP|nr:jg18963 [Pararge aegeria aegeria]